MITAGLSINKKLQWFSSIDDSDVVVSLSLLFKLYAACITPALWNVPGHRRQTESLTMHTANSVINQCNCNELLNPHTSRKVQLIAQ
jgi:hypothetical protein